MPLSTTPPPAISSPSTDATLIDANDFVRNTGKLLVEINRLKALAQRIHQLLLLDMMVKTTKLMIIFLGFKDKL